MLAEWYRAFAEVGHSDQCEDRLWMAEFSNVKLTNWSSLLRKITTERDALLRLDRVALRSMLERSGSEFRGASHEVCSRASRRTSSAP